MSMRWIIIIFLLAVLAVSPLAALHAQSAATGGQTAMAEPAGHAAAPAESEKEGLPPAAQEIFKIGPFPVTNSMLVTWIVAIGIIVFAQYATRHMKDVPDGAQNFWEFIVEGLHDFLEEIIGSELVKKSFWFFATIFIFICFTNWF